MELVELTRRLPRCQRARTQRPRCDRRLPWLAPLGALSFGDLLEHIGTCLNSLPLQLRVVPGVVTIEVGHHRKRDALPHRAPVWKLFVATVKVEVTGAVFVPLVRCVQNLVVFVLFKRRRLNLEALCSTTSEVITVEGIGGWELLEFVGWRCYTLDYLQHKMTKHGEHGSSQVSTP